MNSTNLKFYFCIFALLYQLKVHCQEITAYTEILVPYQVYSEEGTVSGLSIDIVNALSTITGDSINVQVMPWARAYSLVQQSKNTLIFSLARTPERESKFHWVGSVAQHQSHIWGLKKNYEKHSLSKKQLEHVSYAVSRGSHGHRILKEKKHKHIVTAVYERQVVELVHKERADVLMMSEYTLKSLAKDLGINLEDFIPVHKRAKTTSNLYIAFSYNSEPQIVKAYQNAYQELKETGKLRKIRRKWGLN